MQRIISFLQIIAYIVLTSATILIFIRLVDSFLASDGTFDTLMAIIIWCVAFVITTIVHELGHYVGGRIDGYTFLLFQVLWLRIIRYRGELIIRLAGSTKSQCVMIPAEEKNHWNTYQMMGLVFNIVFALAAAFYGVHVGEGGWEFIICFVIAATGMCKIVANGIPFFKSGAPHNDCAMFILLNKDMLFREEYFLYLKCYKRYVNDFSIGEIKKPNIDPGKYYSSMFWDEIKRLSAET